MRLHTRKAEEAPRFGWKKCDCPIYASGTLRDGFRRRRAGCTSWPEAEAVVKEWEAAGAWAASPFGAVLKAEPEQPNTPSLKSIEEALSAFIAKRKGRRIRDSTLRKYETFAKRFQAFCDRRGYVTTAQLTATDAELFYATWKDGPKSAGKKLGGRAH